MQKSLSYDDCHALEETAYLLRSPANAKRLLEAVLDIQQRRPQKEYGLLDDET
jgi:PHD/YefM family antitoxin component YafN of YafNO toxin-antitoxin module